MSILTVRHLTVYRYKEAVELGDHRMMFRPREGHDLRVLTTRLEITPKPAQVRWLHDVFDNSVAVAVFDEQPTTELRFDSVVTLEQSENTRPEFPVEDYAKNYPFEYCDEELPNLARALTHHYAVDGLQEWVTQFLDPSGQTPTIGLLRAITLGIRRDFTYTRRVEKGVQAPMKTLTTKTGSCRDFAVLMMEALRTLRLAARFVSGYIFVPHNSNTVGGGATHAWIQVFLPGAGWIDFDPTNSIVGNRNLIRVAVAWDSKHVLPLWGTYRGPKEAFLDMDVTVSVTADAG